MAKKVAHRQPTRNAQRCRRPLIAVVGPCAAGKSTLVRALQTRGFNAREVLQEHSYVPTMWQRITRPDLLIYLDVSWKIAHHRHPTDADARWWDEQARRLRHARQYAHLYIHTDEMTPSDVLEKALAFLTARTPQPSL